MNLICGMTAELITTGEDGRKEPNVDAIEEFAYGWFDFRQV